MKIWFWILCGDAKMGSVLTNDTLMSDLKPLANEIIHAPALMFFANKAIFFVSKVRTDPIVLLGHGSPRPEENHHQFLRNRRCGLAQATGRRRLSIVSLEDCVSPALDAPPRPFDIGFVVVW